MSRKTKITINGHFAMVFPCAEAIGFIRQDFQLPEDLSAKSYVCLPAGLVPRLKRNLEDIRCKVKVIDQTDWPQFWKVNKNVYKNPDVGEYERGFLDAVLGHPSGRVRYDTVDEVAQLIALALMLFHKSNIAIVAKNKETSVDLIKHIRKYTKRVPRHLSDALWGMSRKTLICHPDYIPSLTSNFWHIILLADFDSSSSPHVIECPITDQAQLLYSFVQRSKKLHADEAYLLESQYGPTIFNTALYTSNLSRVHVVSIGPFQ